LCCKCAEEETLNSAQKISKDTIKEVLFELSLEGWGNFDRQKVEERVNKIERTARLKGILI
jgi:hypothetical protein